jgi:antitoxin component YwqK of YwqJK toxin-antitoxin module
MKNVLSILCLVLFVVSCSEEREVDFLQNRGGLKYEINEEDGFTGKYVVYWSNGEKKREYHYEDGKRNGLFTEWRRNGQKEWEKNYKDGKEDGLDTSWYENGQKKKKWNYKDDKSDGLWTSWSKNGNVTKTVTYKNGVLVK